MRSEAHGRRDKRGRANAIAHQQMMQAIASRIEATQEFLPVRLHHHQIHLCLYAVVMSLAAAPNIDAATKALPSVIERLSVLDIHVSPNALLRLAAHAATLNKIGNAIATEREVNALARDDALAADRVWLPVGAWLPVGLLDATGHRLVTNLSEEGLRAAAQIVSAEGKRYNAHVQRVREAYASAPRPSYDPVRGVLIEANPKGPVLAAQDVNWPDPAWTEVLFRWLFDAGTAQGLDLLEIPLVPIPAPEPTLTSSDTATVADRERILSLVSKAITVLADHGLHPHMSAARTARTGREDPETGHLFVNLP